jgi:hypothetical protein
MMENGRKNEILFEPVFNKDIDTGVEIESSDCLHFWADANTKDAIKKVEGVAKVFNNFSPTDYIVYIDRRYDIKWVKAEIEAVVKCFDKGNVK